MASFDEYNDQTIRNSDELLGKEFQEYLGMSQLTQRKAGCSDNNGPEGMPCFDASMA
jgi:hypothetical protein